MLGYTVVGESGRRIRVSAGDGLPGQLIDVAHDSDARPAVNGLGTVHHVAMAIAHRGRAAATCARSCSRYGCKVTEVRDRCYFKSIYFREPGGVLFEVATMEPGSRPTSRGALGAGLKLPPWEEPHRADIESALAPISS